MKQIFLRELEVFFNSLIGYVVVIVFLISMWILLWLLPSTSLLDSGFAQLYLFFSIAPYIFIFLCSAISMRAFAEERKTRMLEFLFTKPLYYWEIILGKFFACCALIAFCLLLTWTYFYTIYELALPRGNIDIGATIGSYIGLMLLAILFISIGILISSLTQHQVVAFVGSMFCNFMLYSLFDFISELENFISYAYFLSTWGAHYHYSILGKGLITAHSVLYFIGLSWITLYITYFNIQVKN